MHTIIEINIRAHIQHSALSNLNIITYLLPFKKDIANPLRAPILITDPISLPF